MLLYDTPDRKLKTIGTVTLGCVAVALWLVDLIPTLNVLLLPVFIIGLYIISGNPLSHKAIAMAIWLATLLLGFFIAIYRPDGFNYPLIWQTTSLYEGGQPFLLRANTSKAIGGYLVIAFLLTHTLRKKEQHSLLASVIFTFAVAVLAILVASFVFGVQWKPKLSEGFLIFSIVNLGITVASEEAFFRLLIQDYIASLFTNKHVGICVAAGIATLLFAFAHTTTFNAAFLLYLCVGAGYSAVYIYTRRLSMAIAVHFGVNILHFSFLEYPLSI